MKKRSGSPTSRSLAFLRKRGAIAAVVEKSIPFPRPRGTKIDLYGFGDLLSFDEAAVTITQTTSFGNLQSRIKKTLANPLALKWLQSPGRRIEVHGWAKRSFTLASGRRSPSQRWHVTRYFITRQGDRIGCANPEANE